MKTLAIIPAYDEDATLGSIVLKARQHVDEVLVVDDGSTDATAHVAALAGATLIRNERNLGKGYALSRALQYARNNGYVAAVLLDADGQHDPDEIPRLLQPVVSGGWDLVVGARTTSTTQMPRYRRVGNTLLDYLTAAATLGPVIDSQCGFRALSRKAIDTIELEEAGFAVESEMLLKARHSNLRITEVPVTVRYDVDGSTKGPLRHALSVVEGIFHTVAVRHPLAVFGLSGITMFTIGVSLGLFTLQVYARTRVFPIGYGILVAILLLGGLITALAGILLNVIQTRFQSANSAKDRDGRS